jgi:hypothetical protein
MPCFVRPAQAYTTEPLHDTNTACHALPLLHPEISQCQQQSLPTIEKCPSISLSQMPFRPLMPRQRTFLSTP